MTAEDLEKNILREEIARLTHALHYEQHWLSRIGTHGPGCWEWGPAHYECAVAKVKDWNSDLRKAAKQALDELAYLNGTCSDTGWQFDFSEVIDALFAALEEPMQEFSEKKFKDAEKKFKDAEKKCGYPDCVDNGPEGKCIRWLLAECEKSEDYRGNRKQWQNLTDEEIKKILGLLGSWGPMPIKGYTRKLFDEIEAALKEKNT